MRTSFCSCRRSASLTTRKNRQRRRRRQARWRLGQNHSWRGAAEQPVTPASVASITPPQHRREDLGHHRFPLSHVPSVKRPEEDLFPDHLPNLLQPGNPGMRFQVSRIPGFQKTWKRTPTHDTILIGGRPHHKLPLYGSTTQMRS
jgi:hypothetical protein